MPKYDYKCSECGDVSEEIGRIKDDEYKKSKDCDSCGGKKTKEWQWPLESRVGVICWTGGYDPALGCDVSGPRERSQIMKSLGLIEAGDPVGGARNLDEKKAVGLMKPQGIKHSDNQRAYERGLKAREDALVTTINKDGSERVHRHGDLKFDPKKTLKQKVI